MVCFKMNGLISDWVLLGHPAEYATKRVKVITLHFHPLNFLLKAPFNYLRTSTILRVP